MYYKIILLRETSREIGRVVYDANADWSPEELGSLVRALVDGQRALDLNGRYHAALVVECKGPLSPANNTRLYFPPDADILTRLDTDAPVSRSGSQSDFLGLKLSRNVPIGKGVYKWLAGAVSPCDLVDTQEMNYLSLSGQSPLLTLRWPFFAAWIDRFPELGNCHIRNSGEIRDIPVRRTWNARYGEYLRRSHKAHQTITPYALTQHRAILARARQAQAALRAYFEYWSRFDHRWLDGHVPYVNTVPNPWLYAMDAASIWWPLAHMLRLRVIAPPAPYIADEAEPLGYRLPVGVGWPEQLRLEGNEPLIVACLNELRNASEFLKGTLATLPFTATTPGTFYNWRDYILTAQDSWRYEEFDDNGNWRRYNMHSPFQPDRYMAVLLESRRDEMERLNANFESSAYFAQVKQYAALWPQMSAALFAIARALHLLCAFWEPKRRRLPVWQSFLDGIGTITTIDKFATRKAIPDDFQFHGNACDWLEYRALPAAPFAAPLRVNAPETVTGKVPPKVVPKRPYPWNHTTDPYPHSPAFREWIQGNLEGAVNELEKDMAARWRHFQNAQGQYFQEHLEVITGDWEP